MTVGITSLDVALKLEPECRFTDADVAILSIAISLKRIADTLDGTAAGICVSETVFAGKRKT